MQTTTRTTEKEEREMDCKKKREAKREELELKKKELELKKKEYMDEYFADDDFVHPLFFISVPFDNYVAYFLTNQTDRWSDFHVGKLLEHSHSDKGPFFPIKIWILEGDFTAFSMFLSRFEQQFGHGFMCRVEPSEMVTHLCSVTALVQEIFPENKLCTTRFTPRRYDGFFAPWYSVMPPETVKQMLDEYEFFKNPSKEYWLKITRRWNFIYPCV
jgi:hypothetical protein